MDINLENNKNQPAVIKAEPVVLVPPVSFSSKCTKIILKGEDTSVLELLHRLPGANPEGGKVVYAKLSDSSLLHIFIGYPSDNHRDLLETGMRIKGLEFNPDKMIFGGGFFKVNWDVLEVAVDGHSETLKNGIKNDFCPAIESEIRKAVFDFISRKYMKEENQIDDLKMPPAC